jgi:predicted ATPase/transcriptional regulator with XRE-family HTH domain
VDYSFGAWIKRRRKALDLTQQELAQRVGCSASLIFKIESDERSISRQMAELLAEHLEIPSDQRDLFMRVARQEKMVDSLELPSRLPTAQSLSVPQPPLTNLPVPLTSFHGREHELRAITQRIQDPACRLLTLTGPGGVGKTRLAIEVAHQVHEKFNHGACFVSLVGTSTPELIIPAIAGALGFSFSGAIEMKAQFFSYLKGKHILLVLDNLEHLLNGIELLVELLEFAPHVKLLTTSREPLSLSAEWIFEVQGLPVLSRLELHDLASNSAAALFIRRAKQVKMNFNLGSHELPAITHICQLVEGLPLGLELAAAWIRTMSLKEIAREIERSMDFLTTTARDAPQRHNSIRAVFDHSWKLLSDEEQRVMGQLSVFRSGFTVEAAQQVTKSSMHLLAGLVKRSLLTYESDPGRYELHELLRQYAEEKLGSDPLANAQAKQAHANYYAAIMQRCWTDLRNTNQKVALEEIEQNIENIRMAWRYRLAERNSSELLKFLDSFWMVYDIRGWYQVGITLFEESINQMQMTTEDSAARLLHGKALGFLGFYAGVIGNPKRGLALCDEALVIIRSLDEPEALGYALFGAGLNCVFLDRLDRLHEIAQELNRISQKIGDKWMEGFSLNFMTAILISQQRLEEARNRIDRALQIFGQEIGDYMGLTWAALVRGRLALTQGDYPEAKSFFERSLKAGQALNNRRTLQQSYDNLGDVAFHLGEVEQAEVYFRHSLEVSEETGQAREILATVYDLARVKAVQGKKAEAVVLLAVVLQHPLSGLHLFLRTESTILRDAAEKLRAGIEADLDLETYQTAWSHGSMLSLETLVPSLLH